MQPSSPQNLGPKPLYYGWIVVAVAALVLLLSAANRSAPGVFIVPLQQETGWEMSTISLAVAIGLLVLGFTAPVSGILMDNLGPRTVTIVALLLTAAAMIASAFIQTPWQLALLWGGFSGVGTGMVASVLGVTVANRWFHERRSFVVGLFGASTSAGQLIFAPTLMIMASTIGWRWSSVALGGLALLALIPVIIWMRNEPAELGLAPLGSTQVAAAGSLRAGVDPTVMSRAVRSSQFWLLCITFFVCGATSNGIVGTHLIPHSVDHGIAQPLAAGMLALMGGMNFVGTLASGWLTDRYDPRKLLFFYYGFRGLSLFLLPFVTEPAGLAVFAILFGLDYIATVPPTTALVADNFGRRNVGTVYGWVFCAHQIGAASAAYLGGIARDSLGDYGAAFLVAGVVAVTGALLALRIGRTPKLAAAAGD